MASQAEEEIKYKSQNSSSTTTEHGDISVCETPCESHRSASGSLPPGDKGQHWLLLLSSSLQWFARTHSWLQSKALRCLVFTHIPQYRGHSSAVMQGQIPGWSIGCIPPGALSPEHHQKVKITHSSAWLGRRAELHTDKSTPQPSTALLP